MALSLGQIRDRLLGRPKPSPQQDLPTAVDPQTLAQQDPPPADPVYNVPVGIPEPVTVRDPATKPAWQRSLDRLLGVITGNVFVARVLAIMNVAGEAGAPLFSAALAFSTMFAIIPLVLLLAAALGWFIDDPTQRQQLLEQLISLVPPLAGFFQATLDDLVASRGALSIIGLIGLLWGASAYYAGLDEVMRRIFTGGGVRDQFSRRARGILTIVMLIIVVIGTVSLSGLWATLDRIVGDLAIWGYVVPLLILGIMAVVSLGVYKLVPTAPPSLRAALPPAIVAGVGIGLLTNLFGLLTPWLIGGLSGLGVIATVFGALVWLNFSYQILLYGAAWARVRRDREAEKAAVFG